MMEKINNNNLIKINLENYFYKNITFFIKNIYYKYINIIIINFFLFLGPIIYILLLIINKKIIINMFIIIITFINNIPFFFDILIFIYNLFFILIYNFLKKNKTTIIYLIKYNIIININILLVSIIYLIYYYTYIFNNKLNIIYYNSFLLTDYVFLCKLILYLIYTLLLLFSNNIGNVKKKNITEFYLLLNLLFICSLISLYSYNFFMLILSLEGFGFCVIILISFNRNNKYIRDISIKYFFMSSISSLLILFSLSYIYMKTQSLMYNDVINYIELLINNNENLLIFKIIFFTIIIGFSIKLGVLPFFLWVPEIYGYSSFFITMLLSTIVSLTYFFSFFKIIYLFNIYFNFFFNIIFLFIGFISIILGSIGCTYIWNIKNFIGYSSIFSIGSVFLCLGCLNLEKFFFSFSYYIIYVFLNLFLIFTISNIKLKKNNKYRNITYFSDLSILLKYNKIIFLIIILLLLVSSGLPPFLLFLPKTGIFISLLKSNIIFHEYNLIEYFTSIDLNYFALNYKQFLNFFNLIFPNIYIYLLIIFIITNVIMLYNYMRIIWEIFFFDNKNKKTNLLFYNTKNIIVTKFDSYKILSFTYINLNYINLFLMLFIFLLIPLYIIVTFIGTI